eukprot:scaffold132474_cov16-Tisochrysis_lutea.AAC.1
MLWWWWCPGPQVAHSTAAAAAAAARHQRSLSSTGSECCGAVWTHATQPIQALHVSAVHGHLRVGIPPLRPSHPSTHWCWRPGMACW